MKSVNFNDVTVTCNDFTLLHHDKETDAVTFMMDEGEYAGKTFVMNFGIVDEEMNMEISTTDYEVFPEDFAKDVEEVYVYILATGINLAQEYVDGSSMDNTQETISGGKE